MGIADDTEARAFVENVRNYFDEAKKPSDEEIAAARKESRRMTPEGVALAIGPSLQDRMVSGAGGTTIGETDLSHRARILGKVASLIPGNADQFLLDLERQYPEVARVPEDTLLRAIKRAAKKGELIAYGVRKELDSYLTPKEPPELLYPPGGQPQKRRR